MTTRRQLPSHPFPPASFQPAQIHSVSASSCSDRLRSGSPATFKPHGAFCPQKSQGTSPAAHTLQLRSPHKHQFMGPSSKPWEPDLSLPISQMRRLRPSETKVSQDHLCAERCRTQSQLFRERLGQARGLGQGSTLRPKAWAKEQNLKESWSHEGRV